MLKNIMYVIMTIGFIAMMFGILVYYQTSIGRAIVSVAAMISLVSYLISDYLEKREES